MRHLVAYGPGLLKSLKFPLSSSVHVIQQPVSLKVTTNSIFFLQEVHKDLWKGSNRKFSQIPWRKIEMQRHNAERTPEQQVWPASNHGYAVFSSMVMQLFCEASLCADI